MGRAIKPADLAPQSAEKTSTTARELAGYIADMLRSLRTCAKAPELQPLDALLHAAEVEAQNISGEKPAHRPKLRRRGAPWGAAGLIRD